MGVHKNASRRPGGPGKRTRLLKAERIGASDRRHKAMPSPGTVTSIHDYADWATFHFVADKSFRDGMQPAVCASLRAFRNGLEETYGCHFCTLSLE
jgi:hypothetical protein